MFSEFDFHRILAEIKVIQFCDVGLLLIQIPGKTNNMILYYTKIILLWTAVTMLYMPL